MNSYCQCLWLGIYDTTVDRIQSDSAATAEAYKAVLRADYFRMQVTPQWIGKSRNSDYDKSSSWLEKQYETLQDGSSYIWFWFIVVRAIKMNIGPNVEPYRAALKRCSSHCRMYFKMTALNEQSLIGV